MTYAPPPRRPSFVWPILFIGAGVYFLLINLGYIPPVSWAALARFWPVLLIVIGLDILFGRRSLAGGLASAFLALLLVGGVIWLLMQSPERFKAIEWMGALNPTQKMQKIDIPLEDVKEAELNLSMGTGQQVVNVLPESSTSLLEGKVSYYGVLDYTVEGSGDFRAVSLRSRHSPMDWFSIEWQQNDWRISLHPDVLYTINLDTGSGRNKVNLSDMQIKRIEVDSGSGKVDLTLPAGDYLADLDVGSGETEIYLPADAAVQVRLNHGSGRFRTTGFNLVEGGDHGDGIWETPSYASATQRIEMDIDQGSGEILLKSE